MRRAALVVGGLFWMICLMGKAAWPADVIVEGKEAHGQGVLAAVGKKCLVVTPLHVCVESDGQPCLQVTVYRDKNQREEADIAELKGLEVSVYVIRSNSLCESREFRFGSDVQEVLNQRSIGMLKRRTSDGGRYQLAVEIESFTETEIRAIALNPTKAVDQGFSGGALVLEGGDFVGIVQNVHNGAAEILRRDYLETILAKNIDPTVATKVSLQSLTLTRVDLLEERELIDLLPGVSIQLLQTNPSSKHSTATLVGRRYLSRRFDHEEALCIEGQTCKIRLDSVELRLRVTNVDSRSADIEVEGVEHLNH